MMEQTLPSVPKSTQSYSLRALIVLILTVVIALGLSASTGWFVRTETAPREKLPQTQDEYVPPVTGNDNGGTEDGSSSEDEPQGETKLDQEQDEQEPEPEPEPAAEPAPKKSGSNPCPKGEYPALDTRLCTPWRELVYDQRMYAVNANGAKYTVCVPPKNGSTYHRGLIFRILGVEGYNVKHQVHFNDAAKSKMFLVNFTDTEIADFLEGPSERYAMVRNPMQRTLSGYMNARGRKLDAGVDRGENFRNWVLKELPKKELGGANQHFRPQWAFCGFRTAGIMERFRVFRVEEPEKYVSYLEGIVPEEFLKDGWGEGVGFREYVLGPRKRTHGTDEMFWRFVGNLTVFDRIEEVMREDIEFLGYEEDVKRMREEFKEMLEQGKLQ